MKKSFIFVGILAIGYANAQEGNVGINTENPKATLDIQPNATNLVGTTNEGILAPRLSKTRIANIEASKLTEGTLVYATDDATSPISAYTSTDTKVAKITEKGYYFYNGTEWVKAGANGELWAQRDNEGITETYLKPADSNGDIISYSSDGKKLTNLGGITKESTKWTSGVQYSFVSGDIPDAQAISSSRLPVNSQLGSGYFNFSNEYYQIEPNHPTTGNSAGSKTYIGKEVSLNTRNDTSANFSNLIGFNSGVHNLVSNNNVNQIYGISTYTSHYGNQLAENIGLFSQPSNRGTGNKLIGSLIYPRNYKNINTIVGQEVNFAATAPTNGVYPTVKINEMNGSNIILRNTENATVNNIASYRSANHLHNNSTTDHAFGVVADGHIYEGSNVNTYKGISSFVNTKSTAIVGTIYGFHYSNKLEENITLSNHYGIYLENVGKAQNNYSIYTNAGKVRFGDNVGVGVDTPNEKLEVNGAIKVSKTANTCSDTNRGTIKFENDNFYGCKSTGWVLLNN